MEFDKFVEITFTKESKEFQPPQSFIDAAKAIVRHRSKSGMCEDEVLLQKFYDCVEFYKQVFSFAEGEFNHSDVDKIVAAIDAVGPQVEIKKPVKHQGKFLCELSLFSDKSAN